jgi:signal transduction histidine kinase
MSPPPGKGCTPRQSEANNNFPVPSYSIVWLGIGLVVSGFFIVNFLVLLLVNRNQGRSLRVLDDTLQRVELTSRLKRDFDRKQILLVEHIRERGDPAMQSIEANMAGIDADLMAALNSYRGLSHRLADLNLSSQIAVALTNISAHINKVLAFSRQNLDPEAERELGKISQQIDEIDDAMDLAVTQADLEAAQARAVIAGQNRRALCTIVGLTLGAMAVGLFVIASIFSLVRRWDKDLQKAASLLKEQNRELDAFAGRVAHDLRGPLTAINLTTSRLSETLPRGDRLIVVLRRAVGHMESIIADLLLLSQIEAQSSVSVTEVVTVTAHLEEDFRPKIDSVHGILHIDVTPAKVQCGEGLLRQVLWNLADNGVKYRRPDTELKIDIQGRPLGDWYEFRVSDNGLGMTPEETRRAFEPFFRGVQQRRIPGTGLGLSIVKRVIDASGGSVAIDSQEGKGTAFIIKLPLRLERELIEAAYGDGRA